LFIASSIDVIGTDLDLFPDLAAELTRARRATAPRATTMMIVNELINIQPWGIEEEEATDMDSDDDDLRCLGG
jgi:hypothetical protein